MKKRNILSLLSLLLFTGWIFASCSNVDDGNTGSDTDGDGYGSLRVALNMDAIVLSRDGGESEGLPEESRVLSVRALLYKASDHSVASLVDCFTEFNDPDWSFTQQSGAVMPDDATYHFEISGTEFAPRITLGWEDLRRDNYQLLVMLNTTDANGDNLLKYFMANASENAFEATGKSTGADSYNSLSNKFNLTDGSVSSNPFINNLGLGLMNMDLKPGDSNPADHMNTAAFFMSNADGLFTVSRDMLRKDWTTAVADPLSVRVERAVSKVAVFKGQSINVTDEADVYQLPSGAAVSNLGWVCDVVNMHTYLVRKPTLTASGAPGGQGMESSSTDRHYRYAESPYMTGIGWEKLRFNGSSVPG